MRMKRSVLNNALLYVAVLTPLAWMNGDGMVPTRATQATVSALEDHPVVPTQIDPSDWQVFTAAIQRRAQRFNGLAGYVVKDLRTGRVVEYNAAELFPSASLIKLPILAAAFQAAEEGKLTLSAPVTLRRQDRRGGSGILKLASAGSIFTVRELLDYMIIYSDNTATELIIQMLGYDYLQKTFARLGLEDTAIRPDGFRLSVRCIADDNMTSPRDMARLLEKIYQRELVSAEASEQMLDILKHQRLRDRLPRFLPAGWEIAHKTGLLRRACHDCGIVFSPAGDYLICVLTSHDTTYRMAKRFIANLGRITFDYYRNGSHRPMLQTRRDVVQAHPAG
jgi:beta-lactamase class A